MPETARTQHKVLGQGYEMDPIREYAESFSNTVQNIVSEATIDYYRELGTAITAQPSVKENLRKFFTEGAIDKDDPKYKDHPSMINEAQEQLDMLFENDVKALITESAPINSFNPMVGMAIPMHKNIMMNMVWDKGGIPKRTAPGPLFTRTMETRVLITPEGKKIDMWLEQNKMTDAMRSTNSWKKHRFVVGADDKTATDLEADSPLNTSASFDFVKFLGGKENVDHIDVETYVSAVLVKDVVFEPGDALPGDDGFIPERGAKILAEGQPKVKKDLWIKTRCKFTPGYGEIKRQLMKPVAVTCKKENDSSTVEQVTLNDVIVGNIIDDKIQLSSMNGLIQGIEVSTKLDASMRTIKTCSVGWFETTDTVEIGTDEGISVTVSPEELKDTSLLYNINQTTKLMSLMKTAISNRKNDEIHKGMNESYLRLPESQRFHGVFDYAPREGFHGDHVEWRTRTFWDYFNTQITQMLRVLNDPNVTIAVYGEPDIIRRITPETVTYTTPSNIGPVELDFSKSVITSDKRVFSFVGSDDMRTEGDPEFIITLCPRNSMRIIYVIYDYQFYVSNEIRQNDNPALPNILVFERWLFDEYQPVQGRIDIHNPSGLRPGQTETVAFNPFIGWDM